MWPLPRVGSGMLGPSTALWEQEKLHLAQRGGEGQCRRKGLACSSSRDPSSTQALQPELFCDPEQVTFPLWHCFLTCKKKELD